jgi:4-carboxymuconolactone decarboxylase
MTRIDKVPEREAGPFGRFAYGLSRRRFGEVAEPLTVMAYHPRLLLGYGMFELAFERLNLVDEHLKSLAVLKAATMVGCEFCIDIGSAISRAEGVTEVQLRELPTFERSEAFSHLEKLVLRYAAAVTRTPADIPDELFDALREHFSEAQLVELTAAIALENYRARFNHAFGMGSQGFSEGSFCAVPETLAAVTTSGGDQL